MHVLFFPGDSEKSRGLKLNASKGVVGVTLVYSHQRISL